MYPDFVDFRSNQLFSKNRLSIRKPIQNRYHFLSITWKPVRLDSISCKRFTEPERESTHLQKQISNKKIVAKNM